MEPSFTRDGRILWDEAELTLNLLGADWHVAVGYHFVYGDLEIGDVHIHPTIKTGWHQWVEIDFGELSESVQETIRSACEQHNFTTKDQDDDAA